MTARGTCHGSWRIRITKRKWRCFLLSRREQVRRYPFAPRSTLWPCLVLSLVSLVASWTEPGIHSMELDFQVVAGQITDRNLGSRHHRPCGRRTAGMEVRLIPELQVRPGFRSAAKEACFPLRS